VGINKLLAKFTWKGKKTYSGQHNIEEEQSKRTDYTNFNNQENLVSARDKH
jgi:hypothetical protein